MHEGTSELIAIIGFHHRLPSVHSTLEFIDFLDEKYSAIKKQSDNINPDLVAFKAEIDDPFLFDPSFFGYSEKDASWLCPQHRLLLESSWLALDNAGYTPSQYDHADTAIFASCSANPLFWHTLYASNQDALSRYQLLLSNDKDFLATRIAYTLNLQGPALTIQTGCSSSLVAIHQAKRALESGDCRIAVVTAGSLTLPLFSPIPNIPGMIFSPTGVCRPYSPEANGTVTGTGAVTLVVKKLQDAIADNDAVLAIIHGSAVNNDGKQKMSYTSPSYEAQTKVIQSALHDAGLSANQVSLIEGHGTGTAIGDALELAVLNATYGAKRKDICYLGSIKANIGHLDVASGLVSLLKTAIALHRGKAFPQPYDAIIDDCQSRIVLCSQTETLPSNCFAAVHSLGIGGTNAHVILGMTPKDVHDGEVLINRQPTHHFNRTLIPLPEGLESNSMELISITESALAVANNSQESSSIEALILQAWCEVLGDKNWQPADHFFRAGGESLSAINLAKRLHQISGILISYVDIFDNPTLGALTNYLSSLSSKTKNRETGDDAVSEYEEW